jgi:hypothetical protein
MSYISQSVKVGIIVVLASRIADLTFLAGHTHPHAPEVDVASTHLAYDASAILL